MVRLFMWESAVTPARLAFGTDTQAHGLLLGAGIAVLRRQRTIRLPWWTASISITVLCVLAWIIPLGSWYFEFGQPIAVTASGILIFATVTTTGPIARRLLSGRPMRNLGTISYSAYLWHYPIMWHLGVINGHAGWLLATGSLAISLAAAMISYHHIERPILRWRDRRSVARQAASALEVAA
jgi:peptidoglycan/LPS O-acetylase OafA/YrhL